MSALVEQLTPRQQSVKRYLAARGWTRARDAAAAEMISTHSVGRTLRELELLGILEVRLVGGGFCEWRVRARR